MRRDALCALVAAVVTAGAVLITMSIPPETGERVPDALAYGCIVIAGTGLALLGRAPRAALLVAVAGAFVYASRGYPSGPVYAPQVIALFGYALATDRRRALIAAAVIVGGAVLARVLVFGGDDFVNLPLLAGCAIAVLAADAVRARAERHRYAAEAAQRRRAEERLALARDLHDSVAHAMAAINVQAGVAAHVIDRSPEQAAEALEAIRVSSRDVLAELSALLDVLRDDAAPRAPVPDLSQLDSLVRGSELAGVTVRLRRSGAIESIPPAISIAAYRIVQEALTNVARHAGTDRAEVSIDAAGSRVTVEVIDNGGGVLTPQRGMISAAVPTRRETDGPPGGGAPGESETGAAGAAGSGRGLVGIRERVAGSGGRVQIGPRPGGGFGVRAEWPA